MSAETLETPQEGSQKLKFHPAIQAVLDETGRRIKELNNSRIPGNINQAITLGSKYREQILAAIKAQEVIDCAAKLGTPFEEGMIAHFAKEIRDISR